MLRFAGFELDRQRVELRGPDGEAIKLRPQTFAMLALFAANAGRAVSKQELMVALWPNVHVSEDSLFKCVRELRTALGDDQRQLIKLISGYGYRFDAEITSEAAGPAIAVQAHNAESIPHAAAEAEPAKVRPARFAPRGPALYAVVAGLGAILGLAIAAPIFGPDFFFPPRLPTIAVTAITGADGDPEAARTAAKVTVGLADGLARIDNIRVRLAAPQPASVPDAQAEFILSGELQKRDQAWQVKARLIRSATREVVWTSDASVAFDGADLSLQQSRLAAAIGHPLARRINALLDAGVRPATNDAGGTGGAKVVIEQAAASIVRTSRERFAVAQTLLEKALAEEPDNTDLAVALAALQLRGIQMVWYGPEDSIAAERAAKATLKRASRQRPNSIPVLDAYCRFLNATNEFVESLVACAKALSFDPWNGLALFHIGLAQLQLGRFDDALATFERADRFDTPRVSSWTWKLGAGMTYLLMNRSKDALPWLQSSIAITPATGRSYMLLSAAYHGLGQVAEAKAAMAKALALRPDSTLANVALPPKNESPDFIKATEWIGRAYVAAGLPER